MPASRPLLFISDLHLSESIPKTVAAFERFIAVTASDAGAVYILGDLFEYWIGDDMLGTPFAQHVAATLRSLSSRGIALYLMQGNRDFLLGERFARAAGGTLLPDPFVLDAFERRIVLAHGDALCTADIGYQRFRRVSHSAAGRCFFLSWPLKWRLALAARMRDRSQTTWTPERMAIADVTPDAVAKLFASSGATTMIHGHTHLPATHRMHIDRVPIERWVIPDWDLDHGAPRGGYLRLDAHGLAQRPLD
ncbi:UDP-2,3-diacylglucosamine diphosphatase [Pararobbsia silviterrae]|uniref:UDP-2,3-diacylglucosamine hydrolase n=1 Tax=Pararobbsia silviterrae TaxID=1792498 RepID=A0A494Y249_9BURK|nr:UDP-2,3-diacylglucosamine diphosphatase [Pararobbsia silviterrae]RKP54527.1 UDP-2,3-diacylglucosamine diphosphatase [Pararobbsia silviterrae]